MKNYLISEAIGDIAGSAYEGRAHRIKDYNKVKMFTATIPSTGWTSQSSGAYYTINLTVSGILSTDTPDIGIVQTGTWATDEAIRDAWSCITCIVTAANKLTITADSIPGRAIPIQVRCIR